MDKKHLLTHCYHWLVVLVACFWNNGCQISDKYSRLSIIQRMTVGVLAAFPLLVYAHDPSPVPMTCQVEILKQDTAETRKQCQQAAEQGNVSAQNYVGVMYANGVGVTKNDAHAAKWYRLAAEQGNAAQKQRECAGREFVEDSRDVPVRNEDADDAVSVYAVDECESDGGVFWRRNGGKHG